MQTKRWQHSIIQKKLAIIKILGYDFIKNNKDLCKLKIDNKEMELIEYYEYESDSEKEIEKHKTLEVKLTGIEKITNI